MVFKNAAFATKKRKVGARKLKPANETRAQVMSAKLYVRDTFSDSLLLQPCVRNRSTDTRKSLQAILVKLSHYSERVQIDTVRKMTLLVRSTDFDAVPSHEWCRVLSHTMRLLVSPCIAIREQIESAFLIILEKSNCDHTLACAGLQSSYQALSHLDRGVRESALCILHATVTAWCRKTPRMAPGAAILGLILNVLIHNVLDVAVNKSTFRRVLECTSSIILLQPTLIHSYAIFKSLFGSIYRITVDEKSSRESSGQEWVDSILALMHSFLAQDIFSYMSLTDDTLHVEIENLVKILEERSNKRPIVGLTCALLLRWGDNKSNPNAYVLTLTHAVKNMLDSVLSCDNICAPAGELKLPLMWELLYFSCQWLFQRELFDTNFHEVDVAEYLNGLDAIYQALDTHVHRLVKSELYDTLHSESFIMVIWLFTRGALQNDHLGNLETARKFYLTVPFLLFKAHKDQTVERRHRVMRYCLCVAREILITSDTHDNTKWRAQFFRALLLSYILPLKSGEHDIGIVLRPDTPDYIKIEAVHLLYFLDSGALQQSLAHLRTVVSGNPALLQTLSVPLHRLEMKLDRERSETHTTSFPT